MAYLDFRHGEQSFIGRAGLAPAIGSVAPVAAPAEATTRFTRIEWSVMALARRDSPRTLGEPGRIMTAFRNLIGKATDTRLANPRLETLRRTAVLARRFGKRLPSSEIAAFHDAGFTALQLDTLMHSLELDHATRSNGRLA